MTTATVKLKTTQALNAAKAPVRSAAAVLEFNKNALISFCMLALSFLYLLRPFSGSLSHFYSFSILFIIVFPVAAFILSLVSIKQMHKTNERGLSIGYATLAVTSLYFVTALAIPLVLLVFYFVYAYA